MMSYPSTSEAMGGGGYLKERVVWGEASRFMGLYPDNSTTFSFV